MHKIQITKNSPTFPVFRVKSPGFSNLLPGWKKFSHFPGFAVGVETMDTDGFFCSQGGHTQLQVKFFVFTIFPVFFMCKYIYFFKWLRNLLNHNLNLKLIHFPCLVQMSCAFIKFLVFFLSGKIDN